LVQTIKAVIGNTEQVLDRCKDDLTAALSQLKKSLEVRTNVFEDVSLDDDGHQVMVSTFGDLLFAKKVPAGARSRQWLWANFGRVSSGAFARSISS
jgi:hypothetical protein